MNNHPLKQTTGLTPLPYTWLTVVYFCCWLLAAKLTKGEEIIWLSFLLLIWEMKFIQTFHGEIKNHMKKQAVLGDRAWTWDQPEHDLSQTLHQAFLWNLISALLKETSPVPAPAGHWWSVSHSWGSRGQGCPGAAGGTPVTPSRAPEQPCQCWTLSSCPQRRDSSVPNNTKLCLILLQRRWSEVQRPWHPMDKSKAQVHTLFLCGASAHHVPQQLSWKNTWFWPTEGSGRNKEASKQNHFQPSPSGKGLN